MALTNKYRALERAAAIGLLLRAVFVKSGAVLSRAYCALISPLTSTLTANPSN